MWNVLQCPDTGIFPIPEEGYCKTWETGAVLNNWVIVFSLELSMVN